jgi:hypothetical protein
MKVFIIIYVSNVKNRNTIILADKYEKILSSQKNVEDLTGPEKDTI